MPPPLPRCSGWVSSSLVSPSRDSLPRKGSPGRPAHRPFRGMLGVHSRSGLHTRAVTVIRDPLSEGFRHFVASMPAPVASGWSASPGGACTHWKAPPCHGAPPLRSLTKPSRRVSVGCAWIDRFHPVKPFADRRDHRPSSTPSERLSRRALSGRPCLTTIARAGDGLGAPRDYHRRPTHHPLDLRSTHLLGIRLKHKTLAGSKTPHIDQCSVPFR